MNQIESTGVGNPSITAAPYSPSVGSFLESNMDMKVCSRCREEKPITNFNKNRCRPDGLQSQCKACSRFNDRLYYTRNKKRYNARCQSYNQTHQEERKIHDRQYRLEHKEKYSEYFKQYKKNHPIRLKAKDAVVNAIKSGKLIRPDRCSNLECNKVCKPEGHHWSYLEEHWLDVEWLCKSCHKRIDHNNIEGDKIG